MGWDLGGPRLGELSWGGGVLTDGPGELVHETFPRGCALGSALGTPGWCGAAERHCRPPRETPRRAGDGRTPLPNPAGVQSPAGGSPQLIALGCVRGRAPLVPCPTTRRGLWLRARGRSSPIRRRGARHGEGTEPAFTLRRGCWGSQDPRDPLFPAPQFQGCPLAKALGGSHAPSQHHSATAAAVG